VDSRAERVSIIEEYFTSKSFAAVREAFSNAYPFKEVPDKTTILSLVSLHIQVSRKYVSKLCERVPG
jgi:hypothetical protein